MTKLRTLVLGTAAVGLLAYRQAARSGSTAPDESGAAVATAPAVEPTVEPAVRPEPVREPAAAVAAELPAGPVLVADAVPPPAEAPAPLPAAENGRLRVRLLLLLAVAALGCFGAALYAGALSGRVADATGAAVAAVVVLALASFARARRTRPVPAPETRRAAEPPARGPRSLKTTKRVLVLALLGGIAVYAGGGGVFGSFSAETTNGGNSTSSGTLTMSDQKNSETACLSIDGTSNVNPSCGAMLTMSNVAPGVFSSQNVVTMTLKNTGSIDASKLWAWAPPNHTTLTQPVSGTGVSSLSVSALPAAVAQGQSIVLDNGTDEQTFVASAAAAEGATSISVTPQDANATYQVTPTASTVDVVDCYDQKTTTPGIAGATDGADLDFNPTAGNPFCDKLLFYVQETTGTVDGTPGTHNYCWVGADYGDSSGMCLAPISVTLTAPASSGSVALSVDPLNGNVRSGDEIVLTNGTTQESVTASADAYIGATSISIGAGPTNSFAIGTTVSDKDTLDTLNSNTTDTIYDFDTLHNGTVGPVELAPVTANGTLQSGGPTVELGAGDSRQFVVGVYFPLPSGINQNPLQGLESTFGLTWHIDQ